ncbi:uncharacterized protein LOC123293745 [Chrysoperla carnea]|uniref:uncharacterized protein LOC123293745 n=1 Tax=Chrysoperla carnea TaxID=189513 RepID=UPI001D093553|nr:uncharacterized protein LOC123293745 [Chrysoperla carnea]
MNNFITFLCFVSLAVLGSGDFTSPNFAINSPNNGLAEKIEKYFISHRKNFADGFNGLPSLDPVTVPGPFRLDASPFTASVESITVTGLSSFNDTFLRILANGIWFFAVEIPEITVAGQLKIDVDPKMPYRGDVEATLKNMTIIVNGFASVDGADVLSISEVHSDVSIDEVPRVKVVGLSENSKFLNSFASQYLTNNLGNMINNESDIYEAALNEVIITYLRAALGTSYTKLVNNVSNP